MAENDSDAKASGLTRRELIKRAAIVGGAAVWAAPVILMAVGDDDGSAAHNLAGAQLVNFEAPCSAILLASPTTTRTVCATTLSKAKSAFTSQVKTDCTAKCEPLGPCTAPKKCLTNKMSPATIGIVTCVGPGPNCPSPPYASNTKEYVCTAVVTCNCVCR